ncbi:MAG: GWxTD domain-containing protein [Chlorobi bacterium]|nr:GWxTD domain-containing protein [Chlorobiota bacterium]
MVKLINKYFGFGNFKIVFKKFNIYYISFLIVLFFLINLIAYNKCCSQNFNVSEFYSYGDDYFFEINTLPGSKVIGKERVIVTFRLTHDLLNFKKSILNDKSTRYIATPSIFLEATNYEGVICERAFWKDTIVTNSYENTNSKNILVCGSFELSLRSDSYKLKYVIDDGSHVNSISKVTEFFKVPSFTNSSGIGTPKFYNDVSNDTLIASEIDASVLFGNSLKVCIPFTLQQVPISSICTISKVTTNPNETSIEIKSYPCKILENKTLSKAIICNNDIKFEIVDFKDSSKQSIYLAILETPINFLDVGDYILKVNCKSTKENLSDSFLFKLRWLTMPLSIAATKNDYNIRSLYPIATPDEIKELRSGSTEEKVKKFNEFWRILDPTKDTKFNEAMAEYYTRVDYSFFNFRSLDQNDGTFTDRGKIYILNGPPTELQRDLRGETPKEVWIYKNRVSKEFIFTDKTTKGNFKLIGVVDLK